MRIPRVAVPVMVLSFLVAGLAQEATKPAPTMNPFTRLTSAKTMYVRNGGGSEIPLNVITSAIDGWGRYLTVNSPEKADLILEVTSPSDTGSGVSISSSTKSGTDGRPAESTSSSREISGGGGPVKIVVYDARSKAALWSGMEQAKSAMRQKAREDNLVQAAEKVFTRFHDRIEPPPAQ